MAGHWTEQFSFVTGCVRYKDLSYIIIMDDELDPFDYPHSGIIAWDQGEWNDGGRVWWPAVAVSVCKEPLEQMILVGPGGEVQLLGSGDTHEEQVIVAEGSPETRGPLRSVRGIAGKAYAVGMNRTVYRRDDINKWITMESGLPPVGSAVSGFEAIDGYSSDDLYAVGRDGEIWHFSQGLWRRIASPTNFILNDICCAQDGNVYACGRVGTIVKGRDDSWEILEQDLTIEDFWSVCWYRNEVFFSTFREVFVLRDGQLLPVDMGEDQPASCYHLSAADGVLWSIGKKDIMEFDGEHWTRID